MSKYAVLHIQKGKGDGGALGRHIDRIGKQKENINQEYSRMNLKVHHPPGKYVATPLMRSERGSLAKKITQRIKEGKTDGKAVRKDAVKYLSLILSMSHGVEIPEFNKWVARNYVFLEKEFGKDNIVDFTLHMDERTPHIHATIVPITSDGRLSAKEVVGDRKNLSSLQDRYAQAMEPCGLERGHHYLPGEYVPRHTDINEYYTILEKEDKAILEDFEAMKAKYIAERKKAEIEQKKTIKKRGFRM